MLLMEIKLFCFWQAKFFINVLAEPAEVVRCCFSCGDLPLSIRLLMSYETIQKPFDHSWLFDYHIIGGCHGKENELIFAVFVNMVVAVIRLRIHPCQWIMKPTYIRFLTGLKAYTQIFSVK
ncbi:hypothetical protein FEM48_Zijuj03G0028200 [Ziziphus jujuba var. spinosa]|uniref:Uncharacterized protein n=1 Tax=Ziziphus jujuba var. spinosa TaxID=714518 RepID=A0A978VMQ7_ZIZJJ|nr:hypothetical protein FEM48_Zijuj03G0028200 [Ziziphus jujuba var. spinosa]